MPSTANESDRNLLDSAARVFRDRMTPGSRYHELLDNGQDLPSAETYEWDSKHPASEKLGLPATERLSRSTAFSSPQVGDMPPEPPTFRGRIGAVLVSVVRRLLFWYTAQIKTFQAAVADAARELAPALQDLDAQQRRQRALIADVRQRQIELEQAHAAYREQESQRSELLAAQLDAALAANNKEIQRQLHEARTHALQQDLRLKMLLGELRKRAVPPADMTAVLVDELAHSTDPLFVDHAASFRGTRADIKQRLAVYLPYVEHAYAAAMKSPALDLGCGRGEWMEVLGEASIPSKGIDLNRNLISSCRELGLDAMEGEVPQFLQTLPDESRSIVTAFHILEHIPFPDVVELIDQAVRILKPGGIVIFETPNPRNLFVSSNNFYLDPTHRNPIPSEFLAFLVEARGLCDPKVIPLSPFPDYFHLPESDCPAVRFINEQFYGPQDYGIVARKL